MKKDLTPEEIEKRLSEINMKEPEEPSKEDIAAFANADAEPAEDTVTVEDYKMQKEYSGNLMLRIPKELHRDLAIAAKRNGVSLNQYAAYKLAK